MSVSPRTLLLLASCACLANFARAEPLSKKTDIDLYREVPSRNLKGLAARSDGRLVAGPTLSELNGASPADLLWCLAATTNANKWLVGTGPDGKIFEVTLDAAKGAYSTREIAKLDEAHVFALAHLPDGSVLAGTSPRGALCVIRDGKITARVGLPVDSIFDIILVSGEPSHALYALVATGNPARIYRVDLSKFMSGGAAADKVTDQKQLEARGITVFGEVRDRNIRRIVKMTDGRIAAGSAPKGNVYAFTVAGGAPMLLQENRDAEVTDLLPSADGGLFASLTFSGASADSRITPPKGAKDTAEVISNSPVAAERFGGRSNLVWFPPNGFPEVLTSRNGSAFYRLARRGDLVLITGGEQGEILGYDLDDRLSLTFPGSVSSQLSGLAPLPQQDGQFLVLRNNAPGFALLDFSAAQPREAETRRIDLASPALLGALRFNRLRDVSENDLSVEVRTSNGSDEVEGWTPWTALKADQGGWTTNDLRGRYVKLRLKLPANAAPTAQIDKAALYALPQNRRPLLQEFHLLTPNFGLIPALDSTPSAITSVGQIMQGSNKDDEPKQKGSFLGSQIVPMPGTQVVLWTIADPDGDTLLCTFSLRREGEEQWTDIARNTSDPFVQFDISHLPDGVYFTRLTATETDPRRASERLSTTFEADDLVVDHTAPELVQASAKRVGDKIIVTVQGRDALSLIEGVSVVFNNAAHVESQQPADGIRDSRDETFVLETPISRIADASNVEVAIFDAAGNTTSRRLTW